LFCPDKTRGANVSGGDRPVHANARYPALVPRIQKVEETARNSHQKSTSVEIALIDGAKSDYNVIHIKTNAPVESLASVTAVGVAPGASDAFAASTFSREYFISTASKAGSALAI